MFPVAEPTSFSPSLRAKLLTDILNSWMNRRSCATSKSREDIISLQDALKTVMMTLRCGREG
ncbi:hypothetical protein B0H10DRAFT_1004867 [Mycena sp. CBHHK59/15]|nr:hypothetical protein B0H10DRAFT_1004867 [Mycena sp. CBHHK59/15]